MARVSWAKLSCVMDPVLFIVSELLSSWLSVLFPCGQVAVAAVLQRRGATLLTQLEPPG